jgi:hypothetical protein
MLTNSSKEWPQVLMVLLAAIILAFMFAIFAEATDKTSPPTGRYVSLMDIPCKFIVHLKTNQTYLIRTAGKILPRPESQEGKWKWDGSRQEFSLNPDTNSPAFTYSIRRLRVDPRQEDTLQWIPFDSYKNGEGTIDYIRFKRQRE